MSSKKEVFQATSFDNAKRTMGTASPGKEFLKQLLGKTIRVVLEDKLILVGILSCTDRDRNLILSNCATYRKEDEEPISRGDVMVPGEKIATISIPMPREKGEEKQQENKENAKTEMLVQEADEENNEEPLPAEKMESEEKVLQATEHQENGAEKTHVKQD